jgi:hypothetical protein
VSPFLGTRGAGSNRAFGYAGAAAPAQVTGLTATDFGTSRAYNNGRIDLAWTAPANNGATISGYLIQRSTDGSAYSTLVANTGTSSVSYSDTGLSSAQIYYYKVSAINAAGTGLASSAANATSTTVPQAPTVSAANVGTSRAYNNGAATVTVSGGATGGKAISSYTATSSPGSFTATSGSPLTVTGLASATAYTFSVTATNANGSSTATVTNSITATTVPQAPTIGTATAGAAGSGQVSVAFTAGATGGSAITTYTATSSPGSITGTGASSPITVSGLTNGTAYTFTVTATNANGTSTASSASNSATPPPIYYFVGVGGNSAPASGSMVSTDGITWSAGNNLPLNASVWNGVAWGVDKWVAVNDGFNTTAASSTDGVTWTARTMPASAYWNAISYNSTSSLWLATTSRTTAATSTDGITWTVRDTGIAGPASEIGNANASGSTTNRFGLAMGSPSTAVAYSTNGITWTKATVSSANYRDILYGTRWLMSSDAYLASSTDLVTWSYANTINSGFMWYIGYSPTATARYVAVPFWGGGAATQCSTSTDGITWTTRNIPTIGQYYDCIWSATLGIYLAHGNAGNQSYVTSTDGITWTSRTFPAISQYPWKDIGVRG